MLRIAGGMAERFESTAPNRCATPKNNRGRCAHTIEAVSGAPYLRRCRQKNGFRYHGTLVMSELIRMGAGSGCLKLADEGIHLGVQSFDVNRFGFNLRRPCITARLNCFRG